MFTKIGNYVKEYLQEQLKLKFLLYDDQIQCSRPNREDHDTIVGIYLYDILHVDHVQNHAPYSIDESSREKRPKVVELSYLIYINRTNSMQKMSFENETMLMEEMIRLFYNDSMFQIDSFDLTISFEDLSFQEKLNLWQSLHIPYQNGIYLRVAPVIVRSMKEETFMRVQTRNVHMEDV